jgi:hypothetical protein
MMLVNSAQLVVAADIIRERGKSPVTIPREGIAVTAEQLDTAARILREAEPSQITHATGIRSGTVDYDPQERPGFIDAAQQSDPEVLTFVVGILPATTYLIARDGAHHPGHEPESEKP